MVEMIRSKIIRMYGRLTVNQVLLQVCKCTAMNKTEKKHCLHRVHIQFKVDKIHEESNTIC